MRYLQTDILLLQQKIYFSFYKNKNKIFFAVLSIFLLGCSNTSLIHTQSTSAYKKSTSDKTVKISKPYTVHGKTYYPHQKIQSYQEKGIASWYGKKFHGRPTATGEIYNMYKESAAHKLLPLNTNVQVINLENGKKITVRINDRGPFVKNRIIDLSYAAAKKLGFVNQGTAKVLVQTLGTWNENTPGKFYIQVNSFQKKENALNYKIFLKEKGFAHVRIQKANLYSDIFWRVQIGAYTTYAQAHNAIKKMLYINSGCFIVAD